MASEDFMQMRRFRPSTRSLLLVSSIGALVLFPVTLGARLADSGAHSAVPENPDDKTIVHVLNRIGFGPAPGDLERVRGIGLAKYIDQQLRPETLTDSGMASRLAGLNTLNRSSRELAEDYFRPAEMERRRTKQDAAAQPPESATDKRDQRTPEQTQLMQAQRQVFSDLAQQKVLRAVYSERQLNEVLVDFWFNHFNVFAGKGLTRNYLTEYEREAIRPHVLGKFRELLGATAQSPAMLFYLDNWQSAAPEGATTEAQNSRNRANARRPLGRPGQIGAFPPRQRTVADLPQNAQNRKPRGLNENYARELMELHTLGVDGGYTQKDVQEVARAFTGWTIGNPRQGGGFQYEPRMHDNGEKIVLGHKIKAGGGRHDGEEVLDILASHPSTAHFIATKLVRRFVSDDPPKTLVDRAADTISRNQGGYSRGRSHDRYVSRIFCPGSVSREGENAVRVRRLCRPRSPGRFDQCDATGAGDARAGHAALSVPTSNRLRRSGRCVGQYRRATQSHELRGGIDRRPRPERPRCAAAPQHIDRVGA